MANYNYNLFSQLDTRHYLDMSEIRRIYDASNDKYNGRGYQEFASWGAKQLSRTWGDFFEESQIAVKASALAVGAPKPIRSTTGWKYFGGSIFKVGHATKIDENDLLKMQEIAANRPGILQELMFKAIRKRSDELIVGVHNKLTSWAYQGLSTGVINSADVDGIQVSVDMQMPVNRKLNVTESWYDENGDPQTEVNGNTVDPVQDLLDAQQYADDNKIPYDHWKITKAKYRKLINHPSILGKCRNRITGLVNASYSLTENEILTYMDEYGVAPFYIVDEKSAIEIDGISEVDVDSFENDNLVLCSSSMDLMEIKNATSVYEQRVAEGPTTSVAQYSFIGENGAIAVLNDWQERPIQNIFEIEAWAMPAMVNPRNVLLLSTKKDYVWPTLQVVM